MGGGGGVSDKLTLRLALLAGEGGVGIKLTASANRTGQSSLKDIGDLGRIAPETVNVTVAGVTPLAGLAVKAKAIFCPRDEPDGTVNGIWLPSEAVTWTVCEGGSAKSATFVKFRDEGVTTKDCA